MSDKKVERWRIGDNIYGQYEWDLYDSYEEACEGKKKTIKELIDDHLEDEMISVRDELERKPWAYDYDGESPTEEDIREIAITNANEHVWIAKATINYQYSCDITAYKSITEEGKREVAREVSPEEIENANFSKITKDTIPMEVAGYLKLDLASGESYWFKSIDLDYDLDDFE